MRLILASDFWPRRCLGSAKIVIWQALWLDLVGINLCAKFFKVFQRFQELILGILANFHILVSASPRSRKSGIWKILYLDLVNINMETRFLSHLPYG